MTNLSNSELKRVMSEKTDEELREILYVHSQDYTVGALEIARQEFHFRGLDAPKIYDSRTGPPPSTSSKRTSIKDTLVGLAVMAGIVAAVWFWVLPDRYRYSLQYDVPTENVYVSDEPHDCEWDKAPLGNKYCHFDEKVSTTRDDKGKVTNVSIEWEKVQE